MSFESLMHQTFTLKRRTNTVFALQTVTAILTADRSPDQTSAVMMTLSGSTLVTIGYITVKGTDSNSVSQTEELSFTSGSGFSQSTKRFKTLTGATSSGLTGGTVKGEAITPAGEPVYFDAQISSGIPCRLQEDRRNLTYTIRGEAKSISHKMFVGTTPTLVEGDIIVCDSNTYKVEFSQQQYGHSILDHQEVMLNQYVH